MQGNKHTCWGRSYTAQLCWPSLHGIHGHIFLCIQLIIIHHGCFSLPDWLTITWVWIPADILCRGKKITCWLTQMHSCSRVHVDLCHYLCNHVFSVRRLQISEWWWQVLWTPPLVTSSAWVTQRVVSIYSRRSSLGDCNLLFCGGCSCNNQRATGTWYWTVGLAAYLPSEIINTCVNQTDVSAIYSTLIFHNFFCAIQFACYITQFFCCCSHLGLLLMSKWSYSCLKRSSASDEHLQNKKRCARNYGESVKLPLQFGINDADFASILLFLDFTLELHRVIMIHNCPFIKNEWSDPAFIKGIQSGRIRE